MGEPTSTGISGRGRGRPRGFDVDEVADVALVLFWQHGFDATKLDDVTARTGVHSSSLFAAYGNKRGLFVAALERYRSHLSRRVTALADGSRGLDDLIEFLRGVRDEHLAGTRPNGCLMVNTMVEMGSQDPDVARSVSRYRTQLVDSFRAALERATTQGEIAGASVDGRVRALEAGVFGALVIGKVGAADELRTAFDALIDEVAGWRAASSSRARRG